MGDFGDTLIAAAKSPDEPQTEIHELLKTRFQMDRDAALASLNSASFAASPQRSQAARAALAPSSHWSPPALPVSCSSMARYSARRFFSVGMTSEETG